MRWAAILLGCRDSEYATPSPSNSRNISKSGTTPSGNEGYDEHNLEEHTSTPRMDLSDEEEVCHFYLFMVYFVRFATFLSS